MFDVIHRPGIMATGFLRLARYALCVADISIRSLQKALFFILISFVLFVPAASAQDYFWSNSIVVSGTTARGEVAGVGYTITASQPIAKTP